MTAVREVRNRWIQGWGIRKISRGWMYNVWGLDAVETGAHIRQGVSHRHRRFWESLPPTLPPGDPAWGSQPPITASLMQYLIRRHIRQPLRFPCTVRNGPVGNRGRVRRYVAPHARPYRHLRATRAQGTDRPNCRLCVAGLAVLRIDPQFANMWADGVAASRYHGARADSMRSRIGGCRHHR